jgi:Tfp pilus assembly protein PilF
VQPKSIAAAVVAASLTVGPVSYGAPIFNSRTEAAPTQSATESQGWKFPSLWKSKETTEPQLIYKAPESKPSAGARLKGALTNNPVTRAFGGGEQAAPSRPASTNQYNPLALDHPAAPPSPDLVLSMAQVREAQGQPEVARQMYQQAIVSFPRESKCFREAGHFEDRQGNLPAAEEFYRRALLVTPQDTAAINDLALCLARQGKLEESAGHLAQAIQINPQKSLFRNNLATVLMEMGDRQGALQQLLAAHPPAVAYYNMGHLLERGGEADAAAGHYAEAARIDPNLTQARDAFARLTAPAPVVAANTSAVSLRTHASAPVAGPAHHNPSYNGLPVQQPQQQVVPSVVAPLPTVTQTAPTTQWPSQVVAPAPAPVEKTQAPQHEPTFGPKLLPPVR